MGGVALAAVFDVPEVERAGGNGLLMVDGGNNIGLVFGADDGEKLFCECDKLGGKIGGSIGGGY